MGLALPNVALVSGIELLALLDVAELLIEVVGSPSSSTIAFLSLLYQTCLRLKATLPHDYIHGILGLVEESHILKHLLPDYTAPVSKVFHQWTLYLLQYPRDLRLLGSHRQVTCLRNNSSPDIPISRILQCNPYELTYQTTITR